MQRVGRTVAVFLVVSVVQGWYAIYAQDTKTSQVPPAPGRLVDIGGHKLHLLCAGDGTPTVILEAGLGGYSINWGLVQPAISTVP